MGLIHHLKMLERARARNCYRNLWELNLMNDIIKNEVNCSLEKGDNQDNDIKLYPLIVSCGVFLEGHAPIEIIDKLVDHLERGIITIHNSR